MGSFSRLVSVCGLTLLAFGCASEKTRYAENPFFASSRFDPKTTGSLTPVQDPAPLFPKAPVGMATNNAVPPASTLPASASSAGSQQGSISQAELAPLPVQPVSTQQPVVQHAPAQSASVAPTQIKPLASQIVKSGPDAKVAAGMIVPVKGGKWAVDGGSMVTLGDGETLSTLANRYGVPESTLRKVNGFSPTAKPVPGTRLIIPVFLSDTAVNTKTKAQALQIAATQTPVPDQQQMQKVPAVAPQAAAPVPAKSGTKTASLGTSTTDAVETSAQPDATVATEQAGVEKTIATTGFRWPARGRVIASFGEANGVKNAGINIALPQGTPVKAAESGVVAYAGSEVKGQGNLVMIRHADGWVSIYANNGELKVKRGDDVKRGQVIALSGQSGDVPSPQLHFELRKGSTPVDPVAHLSDD